MMMTDGRGKLGGQVASKNRSGAYVRTKVTPSNPQSLAQSSVRATFSAVSALWRGLTNEQRASWNTGVNDWQRTDIFGDLKTPSGFNLFMRLCTPLQNAFGDVAITAAAPKPLEMPALKDVTATYDTGTSQLDLATTIENDLDLSGYVYNIYATAPQSAGKSYVKNAFRQIGWVEANGTTRDIADLYEAKFGTLPIDSNVQIRVQALCRENGQLGVPLDVKVNFS